MSFCADLIYYIHTCTANTACIQRALLLNPKDATARRLAAEVMQRMAQGRTYPLLPSYVDTGAARRGEGASSSSWGQPQQEQEQEAAAAWGQNEDEDMEEGEEEMEEKQEEDDRGEEERYLTW
jgi:TATA-binding protein-associated factor Taf7